ncbi:hypothetical protein KY495_19835 [Massilia sp. PAMC28688]|uniref:hypothetical protein n=1 Tax=Massilia sp. PAMC28688 TaxID=2861283 RepID=UPI001C62AF15|nr:hypothetical protein [Massilia sp. PAMC28688]QYF92938.1 hypothetical protein KY495_19835 [Massilia sp. PAMC28688]
MIRPALLLCFFLAASALPAPPVLAAPAGSAVFTAPCGAVQARKKQAGDLSYQTMWRMQTRVSAMLPRTAQLITPVLRLTLDEMGERERLEFLPPVWGLAVIGKTLDTVLPMRRGGYFEVPAIAQAQARQEDAIVRFNIAPQSKTFEVAWQVAVPDGGSMPYARLAQAFDELRLAQQEMAWWDIMVMEEKNARFDAVRACFADEGGRILVDGMPAGTALSPHCILLPFEPVRASGHTQLVFAGALDSVTLDRRAKYSGTP